MPPKKRLSPDRLKARVPRLPGQREAFPVDVTDKGDELLVSAALPGRRKQDFDVTVKSNRLQIVAHPSAAAEGTVLRQERASGTLRRVVRLPEKVDERHVSASYTDGILWVTLKKRRQRKRVNIA